MLSEGTVSLSIRVVRRMTATGRVTASQLHRPGDGTSGSRGLCSARLHLVFLLDQPCAAIGFVSAQR
jgi:hypothetical protein